MSKWKRRVLWLGVFAAVVGVYIWFFGVQTFFAIYARRVGRESPIVTTVPSELQDLSVSKLQGKKISFKGAEFEVPWDDVDQEKTRIVGNWALVAFRSGNSILMCVGPPDGDITSMSESKSPDPKL